MSDPVEIKWHGRFLIAKQEGKWEYVSRARNVNAAVIVAVDDGHIVLVEQYRFPLKALCLELPAGLVGDDEEGEAVETAAARELEEETGYRAERLEIIGDFASSPGMVSETFTLLRAHGLTRIGEGGGVEDEHIDVHRVPLTEIKAFIAAKRNQGVMIDVKLLLLLGAYLLEG